MTSTLPTVKHYKRLRTVALALILGCSSHWQNVQAQPAPVIDESVVISRAPGELRGTLMRPVSVRRPPVVLLLAGSGPVDRDGNGAGIAASSLRQLADSLAARGVASLRYDKRGVGQSYSSSIAEADLRFETYADDARAWIQRLAQDDRFSLVVVAGHSEGALLGLLAMRETPAKAFISLDGPARSIDEVLHDQLVSALPPLLVAEADSVFAVLRTGRLVDSLPSALQPILRKSVQPYLASWMRYSAMTELSRFAGPCLIVQGTHDFQVPVNEASLLSVANPRCEKAVIQGMNHVLKAAPVDRAAQIMSTYMVPTAPLADGLVESIFRFVTQLRN